MIVIARLKIQSGKEAEFEKAVNEIMPKVAQEEGTLRYTLNRSKKDPSEYLFYEKYKDQASVNLHMSSTHFKEMSKNLASFLAGAPEIEMFEEVVEIAPKA